jgi:RNA polymerase sigma-70 factor, ECF subfamily
LVDSTTMLLRRIWAGDARARDQLALAYYPVMKRLAHGRLPALARGLADTDDIVSTAIEKALRKIEDFQPKREGAFLAYLWQILRNEIRMQIRSAKARPVTTDELNEGLPSAGPSPLEAAIGREFMERYESALERLTPDQQEAFVLRNEMGLSYAEIAEALGAPSPDAARMLVVRAIVRLEQELRDDAAVEK